MKRKIKRWEDLGPSYKDPRVQGSVDVAISEGSLTLQMSGINSVKFTTRESSREFIERLMSAHNRAFQDV